mmetsp:Transcript_49228/g.86636  ORF Transcript_49228/g.86636 Transcript_49228/m.86636 type:complete len:259 (-) Transcript_49228:105-881(-)
MSGGIVRSPVATSPVATSQVKYSSSPQVVYNTGPSRYISAPNTGISRTPAGAPLKVPQTQAATTTYSLVSPSVYKMPITLSGASIGGSIRAPVVVTPQQVPVAPKKVVVETKPVAITSSKASASQAKPVPLDSLKAVGVKKWSSALESGNAATNVSAVAKEAKTLAAEIQSLPNSDCKTTFGGTTVAAISEPLKISPEESLSVETKTEVKVEHTTPEADTRILEPEKVVPAVPDVMKPKAPTRTCQCFAGCSKWRIRK